MAVGHTMGSQHRTTRVRLVQKLVENLHLELFQFDTKRIIVNANGEIIGYVARLLLFDLAFTT